MRSSGQLLGEPGAATDVGGKSCAGAGVVHGTSVTSQVVPDGERGGREGLCRASLFADAGASRLEVEMKV